MGFNSGFKGLISLPVSEHHPGRSIKPP